MKNTNIKNKNTGITLIALVITIIVMLILVAVTINMAINGGLFDKAGEAVSKTQDAIDREKNLGNGQITIDGKTYASIDDYLNNKPMSEHVWKREGDTFTCQKHTGEVYAMGAYVNYTANGTETSISATKSGFDKYYEEYNRYPSSSAETDGSQKIVKQDVKWIVFGGADKNADGTYNTLLITTEEHVPINSNGDSLYLYGAAAYNNGPDEINRICRELYSNSTYGEAQGMTIEDVNEALKFTDVGEKIGGMYYDGSNYHSVGNLTTKLGAKNAEGEYIIPNFQTYIDRGNTKTPTGEDSAAALGKYELNGYYYYLNNEGTGLVNDANDYEKEGLTPMERTVVFGAEADYDYWLASRGVCGDSDYAGFGPGSVYGGVAFSYFESFFSDGCEGDFEFSLRPVVSLSSKLPTLTGTSISTEGFVSGGGVS